MQVIETMNHYYKDCPANVHRGLHQLSEEASRLFEESHAKVAKFVNAKETELVFTRNTTESINLVAYSLLCSDYFKKGDEILLSKLEHHSNLVPWQFVAQKTGTELKFVELNPDFTLNLRDFENKLSKRTRLVTMTQASNTVASITPIKEICKATKDNNSLMLVDAAQSAPHLEIDAKKLNADFLAFSGHKMLGPTGIGALFGKENILSDMQPFLYGGSMIQDVSWQKSSWAKLPEKFEAGTPHIAGAIGFAAATDYLKKIGMQNVREHEKQLLKHAFKRLQEIPNIKLHCPHDAEKQAGIILFDHQKIEAHDLALALDEAANIAVRSGMHCAQPIVSSINPRGLARASFYFYNTKEEIDVFVETLKKIVGAFG
jgi:cysteine desulfurase/selenocysteine lyase